MTTVAQLIEKLQKLDPNLQVRVLEEYTGNWVDLSITDYSPNFVTFDKYLDLGQC